MDGLAPAVSLAVLKGPAMIPVLCLLMTLSPQWDLTTSTTFVRSVCSDGQGGIWCATTGGVLRYRAGEGVVETLNYPDHLPHPRTRTVMQDSQGDLWIATERGLVLMHEGQSTVFTPFEGIPGSGGIYSVTEAAGYVWVGSDGGLARGDSQGFIPIEEGTVFNADRVYGMTVRTDSIWMVTERGVFSLDTGMSPFDPDAWKSWKATESLSLDGIEITSSGVCAYGSSGVALLEAGNDDFRLILDYMQWPDIVVTGVAELDGRIVAARNGAVLEFIEGRWEALTPPIPADVAPSFLRTVDGRLWMGYGVHDPQIEVAGRGILYRQADDWIGDILPGMPCSSVFQIARDAAGRIYSGTYIRGTQVFFPDQGWGDFTMQNCGFPNNQQIFAVTDWTGPGVWASSYHYGLTWIWDNGTVDSSDDRLLTFVKDSLTLPIPPTTIIVQSGMVNNQVNMLARQGAGVWAAHDLHFTSPPDDPSGITGFRGEPEGEMIWAVRTPAEGLAAKNVRGVFPQGADSLWITFTQGQGCQLLVHSGDPVDPSGDTWYPGPNQAYTVTSGLPSSEVYCVLAVPGRGVYAGTSSGLARYTSGGFVSVAGVDGAVKALAADGAGRIWCIGTSGVSCVDGSQVYWFDAGNSSFIPYSRPGQEFAITVPTTGQIMFSSEIGIWTISTTGGGGGASGPSFYPQPYLPSEGELRLTGTNGQLPVRVEFYSVDGAFLDAIEAETPSQWSWNGEFNSARAASGVYMVLVEYGGSVVQARIAVVR